jgi:hypothetical protein
VSDEGMNRLARADVREVLAGFGIAAARRAVGTDASEEVLLVTPGDFEAIDAERVALAVMEVLPHTKVWIIREHPAWVTEEL